MDFMALALQLASRAVGTCSPNPSVGAVLVRDGVVVGEGATQPPGQAHAEVVALQAAGPRARGATLYVTLEPCAHFGRTAPCADALIEAGIAEAHVAMVDPSPWVNRRGLDALEQAGIRVRVGAHGREAQRLNEAYVSWVVKGRPLVTAIYAIGLDGRARCLSDETLGALAFSELEWLRFRADKTVSSISDLLADDPTLSGLASVGVTALQVETGPADVAALAQGGLLDRVIAFVVPSVLGGSFAVEGEAFDAVPLADVTCERLGETLLVSGYLYGTTPPLIETDSPPNPS